MYEYRQKYSIAPYTLALKKTQPFAETCLFYEKPNLKTEQEEGGDRVHKAEETDPNPPALLQVQEEKNQNVVRLTGIQYYGFFA